MSKMSPKRKNQGEQREAILKDNDFFSRIDAMRLYSEGMNPEQNE